MAPKQRLIVIGSGWVGQHLAQHIDVKQYDTTIISPHQTSSYTPLLASAACSLFPFTCAEESIRAAKKEIKFLRANATDVDLDSKHVVCKSAFDKDSPGFNVEYDILVLSPGCATNTFGTPGVEEHAMFMKHVSDALALKKRLLDHLEEASLPSTSEERAKQLLHVAIVGGGPTGIEITAELTDLANHELKTLYPEAAPYFRVTVFDVADHILGVYDQKLYEYATERMSAEGVAIRTGTTIAKVDATTLHIKGSDPVPYGLLLWVTGNTATTFVDNLPLRKPEKGLQRLLTDDRLHALRPDGSRLDDVYALGDAADIDGTSLPTTAEVAVQKAKYLVGVLNGTSTAVNAPFKFHEKAQVTYIGGRDGVGSKDGLTGNGAWLAWRGGSFSWSRSWRNRLLMIITWGMNTVFGKDVTRI